MSINEGNKNHVSEMEKYARDEKNLRLSSRAKEGEGK